ncbi:MAG: low specificity L-threonine aldolase [Alphaproteobacteria bacterium]
MNFCSDNVTGASPEILTALVEASKGDVSSYGADPYTSRLETLLAEVFETKLAVFPVPTGTAANALSLAALTPPWGAVYAHAEAHVLVDECGAPEFYSGGAKMVGLPGGNGKLTVATLATILATSGKGDVHHNQPAAVSLSQATECGTVYTPAEIGAIDEVARSYGLPLHMDGARFTNALVKLGCNPAEATWKAGIDILSFGATKNGALMAEAIVVFRLDLAETLALRRKRAGHLLSKQRFVSAQLCAYLKDDLWLKNARHANEQAARLSKGLATVPGVRLLYPVEANEVFVHLPQTIRTGLEAAGFKFYPWGSQEVEGGAVRLVTAFNTEVRVIDDFIATTHKLAAMAA